MKKLFLIVLVSSSLLAADLQFRNIGSITLTNSVGWNNPETNLTILSYKIYLSDIFTNKIIVTNTLPFTTNIVLTATNYTHVATVISNYWRGDYTRTWTGLKAIYITSISAGDLESDPSEKVLVTFRAGAPISPNNIQLYSLLIFSATNTLPIIPPQ